MTFYDYALVTNKKCIENNHSATSIKRKKSTTNITKNYDIK